MNKCGFKILMSILANSLIFSSCNVDNVKNYKEEYTFNKSEAKSISDVKWIICDTINLDTINNSVLASNSSFLIDGNDIFAYGRERVYHYDLTGKLLNVFGEIGHGANEYVNMNDVTLDKERKIVEILGVNRINKYSYDGENFGSMKIDNSYMSFIHYNNQYLFSTGHAPEYDYLVYNSDEKMQNIKGCIPRETRLPIPVTEKNFNESPIITYHESYCHEIYHLNNNVMELAYHLNFPKLELPEDFFKTSSPMELTDVLNSNNFAMVSCCMENQQYLFMRIFEYTQKENVNIYLWIIDKQNAKSKIIKLDNVPFESYLCSPQVMTEDNKVWFMGYNISSEKDQYDDGLNPSIISVDISKIW